MAIKSLSIRIDDEMLDKLHYVADYEARSANGQIIVLIRECIEKFEEKHGKIVLHTWETKEEYFEMAALATAEELESDKTAVTGSIKTVDIINVPDHAFPGNYVSEADPNVWITKDKDGSYRLTDSEENKWYFDLSLIHI